MEEVEKIHLVASLKGMTRLLQQVDDQFWGEEGLPMGVDAWTQWKIGTLSDPLLQFLDTAQTQQCFSFLAKHRAKKKKSL